uniref:Uncharacterized protein DDB_G0274171-like n=1 Tax=Diabrotica virgifera virgifera TaxID=50390 RepID=A0A6P7FHZ3_DIAVI
MKFLVLFALVLYCSTQVLGGPCDGVQCSPPNCGLGARPVVKPGDCCPTCQGFGNPKCEGIQCDVPNCPPGSILKLKDGACCPSCEIYGNPLYTSH